MKDRAMFIYTNKELLDHLTELSKNWGEHRRDRKLRNLGRQHGSITNASVLTLMP